MNYRLLEKTRIFSAYLIIHKCENEHKCRSVRDEESDSENVRLWLCRTDDDVPDEDDVEVVEVFVVVDVVLAFALEDEFAVTDVRLLSIFIRINNKKQRIFLFQFRICHDERIKFI
jgi:hypothetical protein